MKKIISALLVLSVFSNLLARKVTVTSSSDHVTAPTSGMLRYHIDNALAHDTILFAVHTVTLAGEISFFNATLVIDGGTSTPVTLDGGQNGRIFNISAYSGNVVLKNLKMINGRTVDTYAWGGALYVFISSGTVIVENCVFQNNEANASTDGQGGALRCNGGTYKNCMFIQNAVKGNAGPQGGGAVNAIGGSFINCVFAGNKAKWAGGVYATSGTTFFNCTFAKNQCTINEKGGGLYSEGPNQFVNCVFYDNVANGSPNNMVNHMSEATFNFCAMENTNSQVGVNNNIGLSSTPFKYGGGADSLSLHSSSSCINTGTTNGITVLSADVAGNNRIMNGKIDIGAYEYQLIASIHKATEINPLSIYPNPASNTLSIAGLQGTTRCTVYDMSGNVVLEKQLLNSTLDVSTLQEGTYMLRIENSNKEVQTKIFVKQ